MPITTRTVTGTLYMPGNTPAGGGTVRFMLSNPAVEGSTIILPRPIDVAVGSDGTFSASLWVNSTGDRDSFYTIQGATKHSFRFSLTPGAAIDIIALLPRPPLPAQPIAPVATVIDSNQVNVVTAAAVGAVTYKLQRSDNGGAFTVIATLTSAGTYNDTLALPLTTYVYKVVASNITGDSPASAASNSVTTPQMVIPAAPVLSIVATGTDMHLTAPATPRVLNYKVYRKTGLAGTYSLLNTVTVSLGAVLDTHDLTGAVGTTYYFKVIASNSGGDSPLSNEVGGTTAYGPNLLIHILETGQSNGAGSGGLPVLSTTQPYSNKMFTQGIRAGGSSLTTLVPLVEVEITDPTVGGTVGETPLTSLTSWLSANLGGSVPGQGFLGSGVAVPGYSYTALKKTTTPYANSIAQVTAAKSIANANSWALETYVINIHGEADQNGNNTTYGSASLVDWQSDYEADIKPITDQLAVPMFLCQQDGGAPSDAATQPSAGSVGSSTAYQLEQSARANPGMIICVGPRYQYDYFDSLHLSNHAHRWHGETYAKVIKRVVFDRLTWTPFSPSSATLAGSVITINFDVPVAPLVFDPALVFNPGNYGFEFYDDSGSTPAITIVAITGSTQVQVTLASAPTGTVKQIRYAHTKSASSGGKFAGARGCLRDSDSATSRYGYPLNNWCCHFVRNL